MTTPEYYLVEGRNSLFLYTAQGRDQLVKYLTRSVKYPSLAEQFFMDLTQIEKVELEAGLKRLGHGKLSICNTLGNHYARRGLVGLLGTKGPHHDES